jgi:RNA polymerase sigma-70 factor (ECF subfamily)
MEAANSQPTARLDDINTRWSLLRLAHRDAVSQCGPARNALVLCYARAIRGYVGAMITDSHDADELAQEVVLRLLRGDFAGADPQRGRFRDLLKVSVRNQVRTFLDKKKRRGGVDLDVNQFSDDTDDADPEWDQTWRNNVLDHTWSALEQHQRDHKGSVAFTVLRLRADHPDDDSPQLAQRLSQAVGKSVNAAAARQQLHRARFRFAQLLLEEIARSLSDPSPARVQEELAALGLLEHVREFMPSDWLQTGELEPNSAAEQGDTK